jgi:hypothetical protein
VADLVWYVDRFIPREILYAIEYGEEAAERHRPKPAGQAPPLEMLELFDTEPLRGEKPSPEGLYRDAARR